MDTFGLPSARTRERFGNTWECLLSSVQFLKENRPHTVNLELNIKRLALLLRPCSSSFLQNNQTPEIQPLPAIAPDPRSPFQDAIRIREDRTDRTLQAFAIFDPKLRNLSSQTPEKSPIIHNSAPSRALQGTASYCRYLSWRYVSNATTCDPPGPKCAIDRESRMAVDIQRRCVFRL